MTHALQWIADCRYRAAWTCVGLIAGYWGLIGLLTWAMW